MLLFPLQSGLFIILWSDLSEFFEGPNKMTLVCEAGIKCYVRQFLVLPGSYLVK